MRHQILVKINAAIRLAFGPFSLACLVIWMSTLNSNAAAISPIPLPELTAKSKWIVHGVVESITTHRNDEKRMVTDAELRVIECWKGSATKDLFHVVFGGGILGEQRIEISGQVRFRAGEEVVVFATEGPGSQPILLGMAQGKFHVWKSKTGEAFVYNGFHGASPPTEYPKAMPENALSLTRLKTLCAQPEPLRQSKP